MPGNQPKVLSVMPYHQQNGGHSATENGSSSETTPLTGSRKSTASTRRSSSLQRQHQPRRGKLKERVTTVVAIAAAFLALLIGIGLFLSDTTRNVYDSFGGWRKNKDATQPQQYDELGRNMVEDYDATPAFADFLPGLAGIYGKPMYAFYTNRGQGIASFGIESKDYPIMEFQPANKAYQSTSLVGFRTFLKGARGMQKFVTEPFGALTTRFPDTTADFTLTASTRPAPYYLPKRYMFIGQNEMQIQELDSVHNIETNVTYFVLPEEDFGAFVRRTTITNTAKKGEPLVLSILDGLARMEPAGGKLDGYLKNMGKTLEGFMNVYSPYKEDSLEMPFYRVASQPSDTEATTAQIAGHYCLSMIEGDGLLPIIYDPEKVFADDTTLIRPVNLMSHSVADIIAEPQYGAAKTPSAFAAVDSISLKPGESVTVTSFYGKASNVLDVPGIAARMLQPGFGSYKMERAREIVKQITAQIETKTAIPLFDGHVKQMFLDSSLNGGVPTILGQVDDDALMRNADEDERLKVYHLFSRIHGDLERDYNDFKISPTFFSGGPGRFNDLAQHRRNDVFFVPRVGSSNIKMFLSLLQADGYNPNIIESVAFTISNKIACNEIAAAAVGQADGHRAQREALIKILCGGSFRPGQLFELMERSNIELIIPIHKFVDMIAAAADTDPIGVHTSGFSADHWTYFMDFIDSYLAIYPDQEERLLFGEKLKYFCSPASVRPRSQKYVLSLKFGGVGTHIRQLGATVMDPDKADFRLKYYVNTTGWFSLESNWQHDSSGDLFQSTVMEKLVLLATLKFATRDPYGMGIEFEAGKPGYNTAMNGLPSMLGSGIPETHGLLRLLRYVISSITKYPRSIKLPIELYDLMESVNKEIDILTEMEKDAASYTGKKVPRNRFVYWDRVATAREAYREQVRITFNGETVPVKSAYLKATLDTWADEVEDGLERALAIGSLGGGNDGARGLSPTYFSYDITKWKATGEVNADGRPLVNASKIEYNRFPLFLEGPTHSMYSISKIEAREIYSRVRDSVLYDKKLGMYTLSASLKGQSLDIGRAMAFAPGWLENESVWMDMSYKFYKQLLQNDMFEEFFQEMRSGGMLPFLDPAQYGRSLMECSAFVASSAFNDPAKQGRGFYARLSGATSEFLTMWASMFIGDKPFTKNETTGILQMQLLPALPEWLFTKGSDTSGNNPGLSTVSFKLFGSIDIRYYNEKGGDLFRAAPYRYVVGYRDGSNFEVQGPIIPFGLAEKIRRVVFVASIDVFFH